MLTLQLKKKILGLIIGMSVVVLPQTAYTVAEIQDDGCSKDILLAYFPEIFVRETLKKYNVPKDQWDAITSELTVKDRDIVKQVEAKAQKLTPNPLKDPQQRQAAVKIFRDTLLENFSSILKAHGVSDEKQIQAMLDDIQQQKAKRFAQCMQAQSSRSIDEDDEDEDQEDEEEVESHSPNAG